MPTPKAIENAPELALGLGLYYVAFWRLTTCRSPPEPIPWLAIDQYATRHELTGEQYEDLLHHVRAMDIAYLKWKAARKKGGG